MLLPGEVDIHYWPIATRNGIALGVNIFADSKIDAVRLLVLTLLVREYLGAIMVRWSRLVIRSAMLPLLPLFCHAVAALTRRLQIQTLQRAQINSSVHRIGIDSLVEVKFIDIKLPFSQ